VIKGQCFKQCRPAKKHIMFTKEELQHRAQLVRVHEANCQIEFPTADESNFRIAIMKQLGRDFGLKEVRTAAITGPVLTTAPRPLKRGS
jgi:hypothetical protein